MKRRATICKRNVFIHFIWIFLLNFYHHSHNHNQQLWRHKSRSIGQIWRRCFSVDWVWMRISHCARGACRLVTCVLLGVPIRERGKLERLLYQTKFQPADDAYRQKADVGSNAAFGDCLNRTPIVGQSGVVFGHVAKLFQLPDTQVERPIGHHPDHILAARRLRQRSFVRDILGQSIVFEQRIQIQFGGRLFLAWPNQS